MAPIVESIEINRKPEDVFAYVDDLGKRAEWQKGIVSVHLDTDGPMRVGTRATDTRRMPGGTREITYEITRHDPPRTSSFRTVSGPVRPTGIISVEPLAGGARSKLTLELEIKGHGVGVFFALLARASARKEIPKSHERLREILERDNRRDAA
jgi:uncharacterized membrane protein